MPSDCEVGVVVGDFAAGDDIVAAEVVFAGHVVAVDTTVHGVGQGVVITCIGVLLEEHSETDSNCEVGLQTSYDMDHIAHEISNVVSCSCRVEP